MHTKMLITIISLCYALAFAIPTPFTQIFDAGQESMRLQGACRCVCNGEPNGELTLRACLEAPGSFDAGPEVVSGSFAVRNFVY
jgi:hypothetical protein